MPLAEASGAGAFFFGYDAEASALDCAVRAPKKPAGTSLTLAGLIVRVDWTPQGETFAATVAESDDIIELTVPPKINNPATATTATSASNKPNSTSP